MRQNQPGKKGKAKNTAVIDSGDDMSEQTLRKLKRRLEKAELEHLRQQAAELHNKLEHAEAEAERAWENADSWRQHAMDLQDALNDENFSTHRCIGIAKTGELMVVRDSSTL